MTAVKEKEQKYFMDHHHHAIIYELLFLFLTIKPLTSAHLGLEFPFIWSFPLHPDCRHAAVLEHSGGSNDISAQYRCLWQTLATEEQIPADPNFSLCTRPRTAITKYITIENSTLRLFYYLITAFGRPNTMLVLGIQR